MATEPLYLSSYESEYSTPNTIPDHQLECIYPDAINQLIASQLEQRSNTGTETVFYAPTSNTSMISDDEDPVNPTPIIGNPEQFTPQNPPRRNHPIQLCQHVQPIPDTPESPTPENRGQSDDFYPNNIPLNNTPNIIAVADELRNLTLHPHPQRNECVTSCLVCGKSYDQVIDETAADYLKQTAQSGETVRERQIKRSVFIDGIQSGVFNFIPPGVSQAAACDGLFYSVNLGGQNSGTQDMLCPYLKTKLTKLLLINSLDKFPPPSVYDIHSYIKIYTYTLSYVYMYIWIPILLPCKILTNSKEACMMRERS